MRRATFVLMTCCCAWGLTAGATTFAQSPAPGGQVRQAQSQPVANPWGTTLTWLFWPQVQAELELIPRQIEDANKLREEIQTRSQELQKSLADVPIEQRQQKAIELSKAITEELEKKAQAILLPEQRRRIKQIELQMRMQSAGYGSGAGLWSADGPLADLEISDEQREKLAVKEQEVRQDVQKKSMEFYKKLQEEAREQLLSVLTPAQRQKLVSLMGDKFEWTPQAPAVQAPAGQAPATGKK